MANLYPLYVLDEAGSGGSGATVVLEGLEVELMADPDIVLDDDVAITLEPEVVDIVLEEDVVIEVD